MSNHNTVNNKKSKSIKNYIKHNGARIASIATISLLLFGFVLGMIAPVLTEMSHNHHTEEHILIDPTDQSSDQA